jgi:nitrate reductase delta subunit
VIAIYKILSAILSYPTVELQRAAPELIQALNGDRSLRKGSGIAIAALVREIAGGDLLEAQSRYVDLFDRTRALSLHLFEHVHGESRDRGQAMVSLLERYQHAGLDVAAKELPDYIPLFLEFLSTQDEVEARDNLAECAHIVAALGERLRQRGSDYAAVFEALTELSRVAPNGEALAELRKDKIEEPNDFAALDRIWEETEVRFGPADTGGDGCPRAHDILERMNVAPAARALSPEAGI